MKVTILHIPLPNLTKQKKLTEQSVFSQQKEQ